MCAVSAVSDYYMKPPITTWPPPYGPQPVTVDKMDQETKDMLKEVIKRLDEIDKRLGDRECMDETKKKFYEAIGYQE